MAPHSSTLAWKIPWTEEPGRLQSMGSLRVRHDWATSLSLFREGNGNPLQYSCLENPRDGEPSGLPSMGSHRVRHDWSDLAASAKPYLPSSLRRKCLFSPNLGWILSHYFSSLPEIYLIYHILFAFFCIFTLSFRILSVLKYNDTQTFFLKLMSL